MASEDMKYINLGYSYETLYYTINYFTMTADVTFRVIIIRFVRLILKLITCSQINHVSVCFRPRCAGYLVLFWSLSICNAWLA